MVSTDLGTAARLSNVATLAWSIPSEGPTGMQVGMSRIVVVTGATTTLFRAGMASSQDTTSTGRRFWFGVRHREFIVFRSLWTLPVRLGDRRADTCALHTNRARMGA